MATSWIPCSFHNDDKKRVSGLLSKVHSWIRDYKSYGLFFLTDVRGIEEFIDQAAGIFEIVVKAEVETEDDTPLLTFTAMKHPDIEKIDKKIEVVFEKGQLKLKRG